MKRSTKAALLSALVFPGAGHLYLQKHTKALIYIVLGFISLYLFFNQLIEKAQALSDKVLSGKIPLNVDAIAQAAALESIQVDNNYVFLSTAIFLVIWLIAIIDCLKSTEPEDA